MPAYSLVVAKTEDAGVLAERADLRPASRNRRWGESVLVGLPPAREHE